MAWVKEWPANIQCLYPELYYVPICLVSRVICALLLLNCTERRPSLLPQGAEASASSRRGSVFFPSKPDLSEVDWLPLHPTFLFMPVHPSWKNVFVWATDPSFISCHPAALFFPSCSVCLNSVPTYLFFPSVP